MNSFQKNSRRRVRSEAVSLLTTLALILGVLNGSKLSAHSGENPPAISSSWTYPGPSSVDKFTPKETKRFEKAWTSFSQGKTKKAQKDWSSMLKKHPRSPQLLTALGYVDFSNRQPEQAVLKLETAAQSDTKYVPPVQALARYFNQQKNYEKAYRYMVSLAELRPVDPQVRSDLEALRLAVTDRWVAEAHAARVKGQWSEAEKSYLLAMAAAPELGSLDRELGDIYAYQGKWDDAEKTYQKAIALDPTDVEAKKKLAEAYRRSNHRGKAEALLKDLASQNAEDEEVQAMLNDLLAHTDPIEQALNQIRTRPQITRGDFGGMIAVRFPFLKEFLASPPEILTDLGTHWARKYLPLVAGLDLISALPNHQFRPHAPIRRYEVAAAIDQLLTLVNHPQPSPNSPVKIVDVPRSNVHRSAIDHMVALGVMSVNSNNAFRPQEFISGADAFRILDSVEILLH